MSDSPFKDEESISVFKDKDTIPKKDEKKINYEKQENRQADGGYSQFPKWDLLPPFKLIKRGRNQ